ASNPLSAPVVSGWWANPADPGRGYAVEERANRVYLADLLYGADGTPTWYSQLAGVTGSVISGPLLAFQGGQTLTGSS
ncbi:hypothetical protein ABTM73_19225, partial [Acinetobacter baumannii]